MFSVHVPALARHVKRRLCIFIHVDDDLLAGEKHETVWLVEELEKIFKVEKEGPYPLDRIGKGEEMRYLKRKYVFVPEGIVVQPNEKYVRKLIELYDLGRLKSKATPEHIDLVREDKCKELGPEEKAILVRRLFEFLTETPVSVEVRCDSSSARQWTQRRGVGRLKHVDVRLSQLQDWVRDNIVILGTVKTALNVADLNTKKLTYARRAFLLYHLSQVEYSEGGVFVHTGEDEYERHKQEKKLKEYVGNNQVKNLIRLIQVFSVIRPSTAVWIKGSAETVEASVDNGIMEGMDAEGKFTKFEVIMLIAVILLIAPHVLKHLREDICSWNGKSAFRKQEQGVPQRIM